MEEKVSSEEKERKKNRRKKESIGEICTRGQKSRKISERVLKKGNIEKKEKRHI